MEPIPTDQSHASAELQSDAKSYILDCVQADGSRLAVEQAVATLIVKQLGFGYPEATLIVENSSLFCEQDAPEVIRMKAAVAPLIIMDSYVELMADKTRQLDFKPDWPARLADWYGTMASAALAVGAEVSRQTDDYAGVTEQDTEVSVKLSTEECVSEMVREILLAPARQSDACEYGDDASEMRQRTIVEAKLAAAVHSGLLTESQKEITYLVYLDRTTDWKQAW